tara:strand:+ start:9762 stop:10781 length:1020 start_codon:yes stop_codon:yes gene_type:complete
MKERFNKNYKYQPKSKLTKKILKQGILNGDTSILSRAITLIESKNKTDRDLVYKALSEIPQNLSHSLRIGITGSPGVGKSTFIEAFGMQLGKMGIKVAVLAVDPSSNLTGGSILGDKTRMEQLSNMPNVFIRPTPSKGELGGVAEQSFETILLCEKAGYEVIIIETVGVGQSETNVKELVDFFLLLMLAGAGDELQGIKRGIMELADAIVITKADGNNIQNAKNAKLAYENALHLFPKNKNNWSPKVLTCSSYDGKGIDAIWDQINNFKVHNLTNGWLHENRQNQNLFWFYEKLNQLIKSEFFNNDNLQKNLQRLVSDVKNGKKDPFNAASELFSSYES